jgi:hypothetical protein
MKKNRLKGSFLEQLKKVPIVQVACEKTGISRNSVYRWKNTDKSFCLEMETALAEGEEFVNDMSESQLLSLIRAGEYPAIAFWLRSRHPKFRNKVEVSGTIRAETELTPEQKIIIKKALKLSKVSSGSYGKKEVKK